MEEENHLMYPVVEKDVKIIEKKDEEEEEDAQPRGQWSRQLDFILSLVGWSVGFGNIWRFPYLCNRNGGGAFLIPFVLFLIVCGLPLFFMEIALGQFSGKSTMGIWDICPLFRGLGICMNVVSTITAIYYNTLLTWVLYYLVKSFSSVLPWSTCNNWWNTPYCSIRVGDGNGTQGNNSFAFNATLNSTLTDEILGVDGNTSYTTAESSLDWRNSSVAHTPVEEFWQYNVLRVSDGLETLGTVQWHLALCLLGSWILVGACVIKGVRSVGKVVYVTALLPYVLLLVLLIRGVTLDGSRDGLLFYLKPDFSKLLEFEVWIEAAIQVFYSLGIAWGGIITMSSYSRFHNNCFRDAVLLTFISEGTSFFGGLVVFSIMGYMAKQAAVPVSEVISSGPGFGFVAYPEALTTLPVPQLWATLFFVMLLTIGLDSEFGTFETFLTTLVDAFPHLLKSKRIMVTIATSIAFFLFGLPNITNGGIYVFQLIDWYTAPLAMILTGIFECIAVAWIYGADNFFDDIKLMTGRRPPVFIKVLWLFVTPAILISILVCTFLKYKPPTYGKYTYPPSAEIFGWILSLVSVIPIPAVMIKEIVSRKGTFMQRLSDACKPSSKWVPSVSKYREMYSVREHKRRIFSIKGCSKV